MIDSISPTRATQGQSLTVTLNGVNTHWVAGNTKASFGGEVSVGGAAAGEFGPVQVNRRQHRHRSNKCLFYGGARRAHGSSINDDLLTR